ncbi:hypothetical protein RBB78_19175 [Tunturiibacter empetritectus]|uniref:hypothetical protein n=1 Tax=Tunturiibacter empetritectus TaxID=3069691 RepID=UPI003D9BF384
MSSRIVAGRSISGRGARASRTKAFQVQPIWSSSATREAAMVRQRSSVMRVTFSLGWMRRQVVTALRAPGVNSGGRRWCGGLVLPALLDQPWVRPSG